MKTFTKHGCGFAFAACLVACQSATPISSLSPSRSPSRSHGEDVGPAAPIGHLPALRGDYFAFASRAVGRSFHVYVRLPENYRENAGTRYPVVYVLDGDSLFPRDASKYRQAAVSWFEAWQPRSSAPWWIKMATIAGGTHAADSGNSYRLAMNWLFGTSEALPRDPDH